MYTFMNLITDVLQASEEPLSQKEIWNKAVQMNLDKKLNSSGKTPWKSISARIYVNMRDDPNSIFTRISKRPSRFILKQKLNQLSSEDIEKRIENKEIVDESQIGNYNERDLHPLLVKYVNGDKSFNAYCKTIYHEKSLRRKKGMNEWLHPDIVGVYYPFNEFNDITKEVQRELSAKTVKFYSFEMKKEISFSNLREYYFQAVSNSSWASEGYLVCLEIQDDEDLLNELRRLNDSFGIGIIKLNKDDILQSEIVFTSKINQEIDWSTLNRIIEENKDMADFFTEVVEDLRIGKVKSKYDKVFTDEEMEKYINRKKF